jgi:hypothetical protein
MPTKLLLTLAASAALSSIGLAQTTRPADVQAAPTTLPAQAQSNLTGVQFRALPAVLDARERRQDWQAAAKQAESRLTVDALRSQLDQRLQGLAPRVAQLLAAHPQDNALVSIAAYKQPSDGKQAMAAVTFDGLSSDIGGDFIGAVLADVKPPEAHDIPRGLVFDPDASSYLVLFLGKKGLEGGDIPHATMKQSILAAINHQQEKLDHQHQIAAQQQRAQDEQARNQQRAIDQAAQQQALAQQAGDVQHPVIPEYPYGFNGVNDGYYYPGIGVPIVILPDDFADTRQWRDRQRHREEELEEHARRSGHHHLPQPQGLQHPPGSEGIQTGAGQGAVNHNDHGTTTGVRQDSPPQREPGAVQPAPHQPPPARQAPAGTHEAPAHEAPRAPAGHEAPAAQQAPAPTAHH